MTKKKFLTNVLLFAVLVLAIALCSIVSQVQTGTAAPIAHAEELQNVQKHTDSFEFSTLKTTFKLSAKVGELNVGVDTGYRITKNQKYHYYLKPGSTISIVPDGYVITSVILSLYNCDTTSNRDPINTAIDLSKFSIPSDCDAKLDENGKVVITGRFLGRDFEFLSTSADWIFLESITINYENHIHDFDEVWSYNNYNHWHACECKAKSDNGSHVWDDGVVTKEPAMTSKGEKTFTCKTCEKTKTEKINPSFTDAKAQITLGNSLVYNGEEQTQEVIIKYGDAIVPATNYTISNNKQTLAGDYTLTIKGKIWFDGSTIQVDYSIQKAIVNRPTADSTVFTYNGEEQTYSLPENSLYTISNATATNAGNHTVNVALNDKINSQWDSGSSDDLSYSFVIGKATYDMSGIRLADSTATYDGEAHSIAIEGTLPVGVSVSYTNNAQTLVGTYTITASFTGDADNYYPIAPMTATLTIKKADYDMSGISIADKTVTYDGESHSIVIVGTLPDGVSVSYTNNDKTNAGVYTITASFEGDADNYNAIAPMTATLTIKKADYDMSGISIADKTVTYDGESHSIVIVGTLPDGVSVSYTNNDKTNAGVYTITASFAGDATNYKAIADMTATLTIGKATYDMSGISIANKTVTYDGSVYSLAIEGTLPDGVTVSYENNDQTNADTYTVTANFVGSANYEAIDSMSATLTINKATYDMSAVVFEDSTVTYNGSAFSIIATNLPTGVTATYEGNAQTVVGEYTITASFAGDATNYKAIADMTATLTINKATYDMSAVVFEDSTVTYNGSAFSIIATNLPTGVTATYEGNAQTVVGEYTITASFAGDATNYKAIADMTATLTINKATYDMSAVVFEDSTVIYNGSAYSLAIEGALPTGVTVSYENNTQTVVGEYTVTASFAGDATNYKAIADMTATLTINKATYNMSAVVFENSTVVYNGESHSIAIEGTLPVGVSVSYTNNDKTNAGVYTITASFVGDANNYNAIANKTATLTINKATYDMSAVVFEDSTVIYNGSAFSIEATNLPAGVSVSYDNNAQTLVGVYTITASFTGDATNYNAIADMTATLTINKATYDMSGISIADKTVTYNGESHSIVIAGTLPAGVSVSYDNNGKTNAGVYTITANFTGDADNYNAIANMTATLTIKSVVVENDVKDEETGKPVAKVENDKGFDPDTQLEVSPFEEGNADENVNVSKKEEIIGSYELDLQQNGSSVQPDGDVVVKLLVPVSLGGRDFRIAHVQDGVELGNIPYEIVDGYAVIQTSKLGEFVFIAEKEGLGAGAIVGIVLGSFFFLLIVLFIVLYVLWKKYNVNALSFLVPAYREINNLLFKTKFNDIELKDQMPQQPEITESIE